MNNFLNNLKAGDRVAVKSNNPENVGVPYFVLTVEHVTESRIFAVSEYRDIAIDRTTGMLRDGSRRMVEPVTEHVETALVDAELRDWCRHPLPTAVQALSTERKMAVRDLVTRLWAEQAIEDRADADHSDE